MFTRDEFSTLSIIETIEIAAGGIAGSEGAVVLCSKGKNNEIKRAIQLIKEIKSSH